MRPRDDGGVDLPLVSACEFTLIITNCAAVFRIVQIRDCVLPHATRVKKSELTPQQLSSVPCPTCGVSAGKRYSGAPRSEPHVDRKFAAIEAIERK